jgi:hypothetical protein
LEGLIDYIRTKDAFIPQICHDFKYNYVPGNLTKTKENLAQNSQAMQVMLQFMREMKESRELQMQQQKEMT